MRRPEPWHRKQTDSWYVCLNGTQVPLDVKGLENKDAAFEAFYKLMAAEGRTPPAIKLTIAELVAKFREWSKTEHAETTQQFYESHLTSFLAYKSVAKMKAADLTPSLVSAWIASRKVKPQKRKKPSKETRSPRPLSSSTKRGAITVIKALYTYAEKNCRIRNDVIRHMKRPPMGTRRAATPEERTLIFSSVDDQEFRNYLTAVAEGGMRPGEAMQLTAAMVRLDEGTIVFAGKTTGVTGKNRVIYMTNRMRNLMQRLVALRPEGPLLVNTEGEAWTRNAVRCRFRNLRKKLKLKGIVCYSLRHAFVTDGLEAGVPIAQMAELAGHSDTKMITTVYNHLQERREHLREQMEKATKAAK